MAQLELVENLATRWHHLHWLHCWPLGGGIFIITNLTCINWKLIGSPSGTTCIQLKFGHQLAPFASIGSKDVHQVASLALPHWLGLPQFNSYRDTKAHRSDHGYLGPIKIATNEDRKDKTNEFEKDTLAVFSRFHTVSAAMLSLSQLEKRDVEKISPHKVDCHQVVAPKKYPYKYKVILMGFVNGHL